MAAKARQVNHPPDQPRLLSLKANFGWTLAGNLVNAICQWGVLAVLARLASPAAVGQFGLGLAIAGPVMSIAMLQLRNLLVTDARSEYTFADYFGVRIVWTVIGLAAIGTIARLSNLEREAAIVVVLVGVSKGVDNASDIVRGLFQRLERMDYASKSMMLRGPAALLAMGLTMYWSKSLPWAVAAMACMWFLTFVFYDLMAGARLLRLRAVNGIGVRLRPQLQRGTLLRLSWMALPLGVVMSIISLQTSIPRYLLQGFVGEVGVGYFVALAYPMVAATMIATAMGQSALPRLTRYFLEDPPAYRRLLTRLMLIAAGAGLCFVAGAYLLGRPILTFLYGADYAMHKSAFVVLTAATAVQMAASCAGYGLTAARCMRIQVLLVSLSCVITTGAGFAFVPRWGVWGGALAVLATSLAMLVLFTAATAWSLHRRLAEHNISTGFDGGPHVADALSIESDPWLRQ